MSFVTYPLSLYVHLGYLRKWYYWDGYPSYQTLIMDSNDLWDSMQIYKLISKKIRSVIFMTKIIFTKRKHRRQELLLLPK